MSYQAYGISKELVKKIKGKMKDPHVKERVKLILKDVTKADLQNRSKIRALIRKLVRLLGVTVSVKETENIIAFVIDQNIDPHNTLHLLRLWGMFR